MNMEDVYYLEGCRLQTMSRFYQISESGNRYYIY